MGWRSELNRDRQGSDGSSNPLSFSGSALRVIDWGNIADDTHRRHSGNH
jgi:hypothetical protein